MSNAFIGDVEILNAQWSLDSGRTVELRICGEAYERIHPFKKYQQRRNGRVGTRFAAVFASHLTGQAWPTMEVMLMSWKDSSMNSQSVTFWLDNEPHIHPFAGCTRRKGNQVGDMFALVLKELDDDDTTINQHKRAQAERAGAANRGADGGLPEQGGSGALPADQARLEGEGDGRGGSAPREPLQRAGTTRTRKPRKLSQAADSLARRNGRFLQFLRETKSTLTRDWDGEKAKHYVKHVVKVESLSDLDRDPAAAARYEELIRKPFERWAYQHP